MTPSPSEMLLFFQGRRPGTHPLLRALWQEIAEGQHHVESFDANTRMGRCLLALMRPASLKNWPDEELGGQHFAAVLARLIAWTQLQQEMDRAPASCERRFRQLLPSAQQQEALLKKSIHAYPILQPWFWRESGRLQGFAGGDPLPKFERSLRLAAGLNQLHQVSLTRELLLQTEIPRFEPQPDQRLQLLLAAVPDLMACTQVASLRPLLLQTLFRLLPLEAVLWLQRGETWQVLYWFPSDVHPRYSNRLVEQCLEQQELIWGQPEQLTASKSILLSEVQSVLAVPVGPGEVLFAWQSARQSWLTAEHAEIFRFFARLGAILGENLVLREKAEADWQESRKLHRRWEQIFQAGDLALAELNHQGQLETWNEEFLRIFPQAERGQAASSLLSECDRSQDRARLQALENCSSALVRLEFYDSPRWFQVTDWKVPGQSGSFRALLDVSSHEVDRWFEYLEEVNHRLAADLHDGPGQRAATEQLLDPGPTSSEAFQAIRNRLDSLRSPWLDGSSITEWCVEAAAGRLPGCRLQLPSRVPDFWTGSAQQFVYRTLISLLEELAPETKSLQLKAEPGAARYLWEPSQQPPFSQEFQRFVQVQSKVLGGEVKWRPGALEFQLDSSGKCNRALKSEPS